MGELSAETLKLKGVRGYVVDGGCRDVNFIIDMAFPVWYRYHTPRDVVGYWVPETYQQPIVIGEVTIHAGDLALGDRDGMVILPQDRAEAIVTAAEQAVATENQVRTAILDGADPQQAYLKFGKF
jgi:regulator of RNase E activity RraA